MDFQTPWPVADHMAMLLAKTGDKPRTILEPTPGEGNLVHAAQQWLPHAAITAPNLFEDVAADSRFDAAIMNPPFTPMAEGYRFLSEVMAMTDRIVALLPWLVVINSEKRVKAIMDFGLISITHLPRKTFPGCRIQCCILNMERHTIRPATFHHFTW